MGAKPPHYDTINLQGKAPEASAGVASARAAVEGRREEGPVAGEVDTATSTHMHPDLMRLWRVGHAMLWRSGLVPSTNDDAAATGERRMVIVMDNGPGRRRQSG